ncbi:MAG: helix-turn-helix transcriptional regulator [Bacteroidales bacterium]|nr:helix-turn-helix transcriptional regulator [Bacteroidales bacterium]
MNLQTIGNTIRDLRKLKGVSQADIAGELDISIAAVSKIERGLTNISIQRLDQIATILNTSVFTLLGVEKTDISKIAVSQEVSSLQKELQMTKELLKAKDEIIELLKNKPTV